jgi:superfamily II DNA or RNA helicase
MSLAPRLSLIRSQKSKGTRAVFGVDPFGYVKYSSAALPDRVYVGLDSAQRPESVIHLEPEADVDVLPTPLETLLGTSDEEREAWPTETQRAARRLDALWLLIEDRHRLLDASVIEPLAHQASLVQHVLSSPELRRVLVADEVGLGKTIEAGLIIKHLVDASSGAAPRVLYLAPASLVDNVVDELERLGLKPRQWSARSEEARLRPGDSDPLVVASIHRAVVRVTGGVDHYATVAESGPWDVLIVDEAHHLSDWSVEGNDPRLRMRLVRDLVRKRLNPDGRVILLTGTPHQGHDARFRNLLKLLSERESDERDARGRMIYRIKDDIRDWDGNPLFPIRDVRPNTLVDVDEGYRRWLQLVHKFFSTADSGESRASGWRRAQALQWCSSSPSAGLAYLVRFALRAGFTMATLEALAGAISALRPYRGRSETESAQELEAYLLKQVDQDGEQIEDVDPQALSELLSDGAELIRTDALAAKIMPLLEWLEAAPQEKFVIFAQPIETVHRLQERLERTLGRGSVALLVGTQDKAERAKQIRRFWEREECRVLVSSRAGGEGINLQVSRRLVHFDVPWNPMEMEQRVGRVHRFGGSETIIVETVVLRGSREERVLDRARARLGRIANDLDRDRFERLFSRTMSMIPLEELANLMAGEDFGPFTPDEELRLDKIVKQGYERWRKTDETFRRDSARARGASRGQTNDADLEHVLINLVGARIASGWKRRILTHGANGEPERADVDAKVFELSDGTRGYVGRDGGVGIIDPGGESLRLPRLGLNTPEVAKRVREVIAGGANEPRDVGAGVALVPLDMWRSWVSAPRAALFAKGGILLAYCVRALDMSSKAGETTVSMHFFLSSPDGEEVLQLAPSTTASLIRSLRELRPKRTRPTFLATDRLLEQETRRLNDLKAARPGDPVNAVFPVAAIWLEPTA